MVGAQVLEAQMKAVSVSIVDKPVDPLCTFSDGRFLAIEWEQVSPQQTTAIQTAQRTCTQPTPPDESTS